MGAAQHVRWRVCCCVLQVILTYGMSDTTRLFLKEASRKREFQVSQDTVTGCALWTAHCAGYVQPVPEQAS